MLWAVLLFGVAALGGATLAVIRVGGRGIPPLWLALIHGLIAASGLVALTISVLTTAKNTWALVALIGFVIAAAGGFLLFSFHLRKKALPLPLVGIHGGVAVIAFVILLFGVLSAGT